MHVIGARFERAAAARGALDELRKRLALEPGAAGVRPLGSTDYDDPLEYLLLAGRFEDHEVAQALAVIRGRGGVIVELRREGEPATTLMGPAGPSAETRMGTGRLSPRPTRPNGPGSPPKRLPRAARARAPRPRRVSR